MAINNEINVGVKVTVDKSQLTSLRNELTNVYAIAKSNSKDNDLSKTMREDFAKTATTAQQLKDILNSSWNSKFNQLDMTKFNSSMKQAGLSVEQIRTTLNKTGDTHTFNKLASEVLGANIQLKQSNELLDKMAITMANTVRFGISSSIFNNITGAISKAYNYVQDLDESLNSIRVVTGQSAEQMEQLAKQANSAAQALGKTTLDYTDASLIYYQQGLSDEEVSARTETTLKMANVTGESASDVSDYMTAIWNNFDDGSESLEHYADVITALGASTASSSEEIAEGLEKFAAVGDTVGLSYEYATSALATVVANTRQSADTVGTAFKTLFARIQDLELGNTLDDGTTLGTYSEALEKVGVNIKDTNGDMKDMDTILSEMATKWSTLSKDQQTALAQAVAGTRQYTQLVSLMDNWDDMTENLKTAADSTGTLNEQQEIYMDSYEAHVKELTAEFEELYSNLLDTDGFKSVLEVLEKGVGFINDQIEGVGGGLTAVINIASQLGIIFRQQIGSAILQQVDNTKQWWNAAVNAKKIVSEWSEAVKQNLSDNELNANSKYVEKEAQTIQEVIKLRKGLSSQQQQTIQNNAKELALLEEERDVNAKLVAEARKSGIGTASQANENAQAAIKAEADARDKEEMYDYYDNQIKKIQQVNDEKEKIVLTDKEIDELEEIIDTLAKEEYFSEKEINELRKIGVDFGDQQVIDKTDLLTIQNRVNEKLQEEHDIAEENSAIYEQQVRYRQAFQDQESGNAINRNNRINNLNTENENIFEQGKRNAKATSAVNTVMAITQVASAAAGAIETFADENSTASEKANAAWSSVSNTISGVVSAFNPVAGMALEAVLSIAKAGAEALGLWDNFEDWFKSASEKLDEINEKINEFKENLSNTMSEESENREGEEYLESIKDRFNELQKLAEKGLLTDDMQTEYEGYLEKVKEYNDDAIISYDAQGNMISSNTDLIQESIDKLQEENNLLTKTQFSNSKWNEYKNDTEEQEQQTHKVVTESKQDYENYISNNRYLATSDEVESANNLVAGFGTTQKQIDASKALTKLFSQEAAQQAVENNSLEEWKKEVDKALKTAEDLGVTTGKATQKRIDDIYEKLTAYSDKYEEAKYNDTNQTVDLDTIQLFVQNSTQYQKLANSQGDETAARLLNAYTNGLETGAKKYLNSDGTISLDKIKDDIQDYLNSVNSLFSNEENGTVLKTLYDDILGLNSEDYNTSKEYEDAITARVEDFLSKLTKKQYNKLVKNGYLKKLFQSAGLENVSTEWNSETNQAEFSNNGNVETSGEKIARSVGNSIAKSDNKKVNSLGDKNLSKEIENYLQKSLSETELGTLDTSEFVSDFYSVLTDALDEDGSFKDGWDINKVIQKALDKQGIKEETFNKNIASTASELNVDEEGFKTYVTSLQEANDNLEENSDLAIQVAKDSYTLESNISDLNDVLDDENSLLKKVKNNQKLTTEETEKMGKVITAVKKVLNTDSDAIDYSFVQENISLIQEAAEGDIEALEKLRKKAAETQIKVAFDVEDINSLPEEIQNMVEIINNMDLANLKVGATLDEAGLTTKMQQLVDKFPEYRDAINTILSQIGFDPQITYKEVTVTGYDADTSTATVDYVNSDGKGMSKQVKTSGSVKIGDKISIPVINGSGTTYTSPKVDLNLGSGKTGSSGSSSSSNKDYQTSEKDLYQKVNSQLDKNSANLKTLQTQADRLTGKDYSSNLIKQIQNINENIDLTKEKLSIAQGEAADYANKLTSTYGVTFDSNGVIQNYSEIYDAELAAYNKAVQKYNKSNKGTKAQKALEAAQERYDNFKDYVDKYDELIGSTITDLQQEIQDAIDDAIEIKIKVYTEVIDVAVDFDSAYDDWLDFESKVLKDIDDDNIVNQFDLALKKIQRRYESNGLLNVLSNEATKVLTEYNKMLNGQDSIFSMNGTSSTTSAEEALKEARDNIMSAMEDTKDEMDELEDYIQESIDKTAEYMNDLSDVYNDFVESANHSLKVIQTIAGENAYGEMDSYYQKITDAYQKQYDIQLAQAAIYKQQMDELGEAGKEGSDEWIEAEQNWIDASSEAQSTLENLLDSITEAYTNTINAIFTSVTDGLTGGLSLSYVEKEWGLINDAADEYLDTLNAAYDVQKLENEYIDSINDLTSISAQQKLNNVMEQQLAILREKDKLSQYDIDRAELRYQIEVKRLQLEEAQANKSTMKLRRDSQGNYTYQYTSDSDEVRSIQEEMTDLYNQLYNLDAEEFNSETSSVIDKINSFKDELTDALNIKDADEQAKQIQTVIDNYYSMIDAETEKANESLSGLVESVGENIKELFGENSDEYKEFMANPSANLTKYVSGLDSAVVQLISNLTSNGGMLGVFGDAGDQISEKLTEYLEILQTTSAQDQSTEATLTSVSDILSGMVESQKTTTEDMKARYDAAQESYNQANATLSSIAYALERLYEKTTGEDISGQMSSIGYNSSLASGGYTGDWADSNGRVALLHKKEIVLNATDTENLLNTIGLLRGMTTNVGAVGFNGTLEGSNGLQQQVTIEANFPNATSANEIEEALNNLMNSASQYIHTK